MPGLRDQLPQGSEDAGGAVVPGEQVLPAADNDDGVGLQVHAEHAAHRPQRSQRRVREPRGKNG